MGAQAWDKPRTRGIWLTSGKCKECREAFCGRLRSSFVWLRLFPRQSLLVLFIHGRKGCIWFTQGWSEIKVLFRRGCPGRDIYRINLWGPCRYLISREFWVSMLWNQLSWPTQWGVVVMCSRTGTRSGVDERPTIPRYENFWGFLNLLNLCGFYLVTQFHLFHKAWQQVSLLTESSHWH